jgi:hypothetical protein
MIICDLWSLDEQYKKKHNTIDPYYLDFWFISLIQYNGQRNRNIGEKEMSPKILYRKLQIYHDEP